MLRAFTLLVFLSISKPVFCSEGTLRLSKGTDSIASALRGPQGSGETFFCLRDSFLSFRSQKGFVPSFCHDMKEQFLAPFRMNGKQLAEFGTASLITYGLILNDALIDDNYFRYLKTKNETVEEVSPRVTKFGANYAAYFIIGYAGYSFLNDDYKAWRTSVLATQACLTSGLWVRVGKMMTSRERPSEAYWSGVPGGRWSGFVPPFSDLYKSKSQSHFDAFPSGHTSAAFSIATVFAMQYSDKLIVPIAAYTMASLVGVSRLIEHEHWSSDVFVGGIVGYLCGRQVVMHDRKLFSQSPSPYSLRKKKKVQLSFASTGNGLSFAMVF